MYQQLIEDFIKREHLPLSYAEDATQWFLPLLAELEIRLVTEKTRPLIIGINGAQGTGKSTLAKLMASLLESKGFRVANLSIDDFYLSKARRCQLAEEVHPLLSSRGVPGTHDIRLALEILQQLGDASAKDNITLPEFDKAADDCVSSELCPELSGPIHVIIVEGWFIGAKPQQASELESAVNELEAMEDAEGRWRQFVNRRLAEEYQQLFSRLNLLIMLKAPGFEQVFDWRRLQEDKLRRSNTKNTTGLMDDDQLRRFIQHFERLTRHCLDTVADRADLVFLLDKHHRISGRILKDR